MRNSKMKGFTLIELIVVIAIIGVLAAILVPSMMGYVGKSKLATANSNAKLLFTNTATYASDCEVKGYAISDANSNISVDLTTSGGSVLNNGQTSDMINALKSMMGGGPAGGVGVVAFSGGAPKRDVWAKTTADVYQGAYPQATTIKSTDTGVAGDVKVTAWATATVTPVGGAAGGNGGANGGANG